MITKLEILEDISIELQRFDHKLKLALKEQSIIGTTSSHHYAACKRAALDLKNELTKITYDAKYRKKGHEDI